ncbi:MAG TPA: hypothetical protein VI365_00645, partial [Trebonia sp.]
LNPTRRRLARLAPTRLAPTGLRRVALLAWPRRGNRPLRALTTPVVIAPDDDVWPCHLNRD